MWTPLLARVAAMVALACVAPACSSDDGGEGTGGNSADSSATDGGATDGGAPDGATDGGGTDGASASTTPWFPDGAYFVGVELAEFSGVKLKMKAVVKSAGDKDKASKIGSIALYGLPVAADDPWVQDKPMGTLKDVPIDAKGAFIADFGEVTVPGKTLPTGADSKVTIILHAKSNADGTWCGLMKGEVPDFSTKLEKSTFKAVKFGTQPKTGYETTCEKKAAKKYNPIAACPKLGEGLNKMQSAETEREFYVHLPKGATGAAALPIVFLYHGVGGTPEKFKAETKFEELLKDNSFILIVPASSRVDGKKETLDWYFTGELFDTDNRDLVFFDDAVKCVGEQWKVDAKRIYVTGMSGGGLMSTFIAANRGDKVAAAAPFSGGYLHAQWPNTDKTPFMVTWGGPKDEAYSQDFDKLAKTLIGYLEGGKHPLAKCDHGLEHVWPKTASKDAWEFLSQFTLGGGETPDKSKLPKYCK